MSVAQTVMIGLILGLIYFFYKKWKEYNSIWKHLRLIPGPKGYPLIGNLVDLMKDLEGNWKTLYEYSKQYPIFRLRVVTLGSSVFLYQPEDIEKVLCGMKHISKGSIYDLLHDWLGSGLLTSTGAKWQKRRKILTPAFHFSILNEFVHIFNRETETLVEDLKSQANKPVNVLKPITEFTLSSIGETSLGLQINQESNSSKYKQAIFDFGEIMAFKTVRPWLTFPVIRHLFPSVRADKKTVATLHDFSWNVIQKRKKQVETDARGSYSTRKKLALLDLLLTARYQDGVDISDEDIREEIDTFMFEGHDTTAVSICFTLMALANEPKIQDEIYQEIIDVMGDIKKQPDSNDLTNMVFMERCIKESLRLYPSVPMIARMSSEGFTSKDGYFIPEGCELQLHIYAMHHSESVWENPEKFDPDRFLTENISTRHPFSYVPFSAGPRNCIGQRFAMLEMKAALCGILRSFRLEPVDRPSDMRFKIDLVLRTSNQVRVTFVPRY